MKPGHLIIRSALLLALATPLMAEEGGASRYVPGNSATLIDTPPTKAGWSALGMYLHYDGDASAAGNFPNAGLVTAGLDATSDALLAGGFYTFDQPVLGSHYSIGAFVPYMWVDVEATVIAGGTTGFRRDTADGVGDMAFLPVIMAWKDDCWQYSALLTVTAPTGDYDTGTLANVGRNYWTFDPAFHVAYSNPKNGFNAAVFSGITFNTENDDTDYKSGSAFHIDASVQQMLPLGSGFLTVGFNAFYYDQIEGDSGSGANLGDFEGRDIGIGPVLGYVLPCGESTLVAEARWLPELDTKRRLEGDFYWLKIAYQF